MYDTTSIPAILYLVEAGELVRRAMSKLKSKKRSGTLAQVDWVALR